MRHKINSEVFLRGDALSYYLLGVFATDGCLHKPKNRKLYKISMSSKDRDWIEVIKNLICPNIKLTKYKNSECFQFVFQNKNVENWLLYHGLTARKSLTLEMKNIPDEYIRDFLRASIDGDGTLNISNRNKKRTKNFKTAICTGSAKFSKQLQEYFEKLGIKSLIFELRDSKGKFKDGREIFSKLTYNVYLGKIPTLKAIDILYYDDNLICLDRKREKAKEIKKIYQYELDTRKIKINPEIKWPEPEKLLEMAKTIPHIKIVEELKVSKARFYKKLKKIKEQQLLIKSF